MPLSEKGSLQKKDLLWIVNVVSFVLLSVLVVTGLFNWLFLPHGAGAPEGVGRALRHLLRDFHAWTAVVFCLVCAVHVGLHWGYVRGNLKRSGLLG
ncbi:MAG: DUF4405 domain-containing protein [Desulfobacterales bacterium]|jgi:hypothetical protein